MIGHTYLRPRASPSNDTGNLIIALYAAKKQTAMRLSVYSLQISIDLFGTFQAFADGPDDQGRSSFGISCRKQAFFRIDQVRA